MAARPKEFFLLFAKTEADTGLPITADLYKRPKAAPIPELAPFYAWKGNIGCAVEEPVSEDIFGPELAIRVRKLLEDLLPLYEYFNRFKV